MFKVEIVYYEGELNRAINMSRAKISGNNENRPLKVRSSATFPIVPRPGDHIFFPLPKAAEKYFKGNRVNGKTIIGGVVQWAELNDSEEAIYIIVTDQGHTGYGKCIENIGK